MCFLCVCQPGSQINLFDLKWDINLDLDAFEGLKRYYMRQILRRGKKEIG